MVEITMYKATNDLPVPKRAGLSFGEPTDNFSRRDDVPSRRIPWLSRSKLGELTRVGPGLAAMSGRRCKHRRPPLVGQGGIVATRRQLFWPEPEAPTR